MAEEQVSVRERIERQLQQTLVTALNLAIVNVQRFDRNGNKPVADEAGDFPEAWVVITAGEEDEFGGDDDHAAIGMETMLLPITIDYHLIKQPAGVTTAEFGNACIARLKAAVMADPQRSGPSDPEDPESDPVELALDTQITGTFGPMADDEQRDTLVGLDCEITYRHPIADPYSVG